MPASRARTAICSAPLEWPSRPGLPTRNVSRRPSRRETRSTSPRISSSPSTSLRMALPTPVGNAMRNDVDGLDDIRGEVDRVSRKLGRRLTFLVGKPGLDGHSNGAEQIAVRARDAGMQVVYE